MLNEHFHCLSFCNSKPQCVLLEYCVMDQHKLQHNCEVGEKWSMHQQCTNCEVERFLYLYSTPSALSDTGSRGQQTQQRHPDVSLPRHLLQLLRVEPKAFPGQPET
ncbi:hypothetical protein ILYODFUR_029122 [Ilyodon furcidens]|uniref:Uncharacterized protein n=1 Tax=Ilyodon furcidens TaxID=33524 RepID=A0ABV0UDK2_9TELE